MAIAERELIAVSEAMVSKNGDPALFQWTIQQFHEAG